MKSGWSLYLMQKMATILAVALLWVAAFRLNDLFFDHLEYSRLANWIFLPAAIRMLSVLVFGFTGAIGLMIGAYLTMPPEHNLVIHKIMISISSGAAPLLAVWLCRHIFMIAHDLAGLRAKHVIALSLANAAANSILLNLYLALTKNFLNDSVQIITVFVGDVLGTALVLLLISTLLEMLQPRQPG